MTSSEHDTQSHLRNLADNLQLLADMAYSAVSLAVPSEDGSLRVLADARPYTAIAPLPASREGQVLAPKDEIEAYEAFTTGRPAGGSRSRTARGIKYATFALPVGEGPCAVVLRDIAEQVTEAPGAMETAFMAAADELLEVLTHGPITDSRTNELFSTRRTAGDGVMRITPDGKVSYASPNAVNIMRLAGVEGPVIGRPAAELPGGGFGISPVAGGGDAIEAETDVAGRVLLYRTVGLTSGALVLVEDVTEARRRELELKVKDATIREVHHRVKNNLQTIASLLRMQARRVGDEGAKAALGEANERVAAMAVVQDLLSGSDAEQVDFAEAARTIVDLVARGLLGEKSRVDITVEAATGDIEARAATSLALVLAELVHNALEHGIAGRDTGKVTVRARRLPEELVLAVSDDGPGIPNGFDPESDSNLGLEIVRSVVKDDLKGTLSFSGGRGVTVTVRVPLVIKDGE
jgi:two-component sensor histidine kinase